MPELAEVEFFRRRWHEAAHGQRIASVHTHDGKKLFRGIPVAAFRLGPQGITVILPLLGPARQGAGKTPDQQD